MFKKISANIFPKYLSKFCTLLPILLTLSSCGGGGGGSGDGDVPPPPPPPPPPSDPLLYMSGSPLVKTGGTDSVSVSVATNKDATQVAYIVLLSGTSKPSDEDFFAEDQVEGRFGFDVPKSNTFVEERNNEGLTPDTTYDVYVAARAGEEVIISDNPFVITTDAVVTGDVWQESCELVGEGSIYRGDLNISSADDLSRLRAWPVVDGTLTFSGGELPSRIDLGSMICVKNLAFSEISAVEAMDFSQLKVMDSFKITGAKELDLPVEILGFPELKSVKSIAISRAVHLTELSAPKVTALDALDIEEASALEKLLLPELETVNRLRLSGAALKDFSGMGSLVEVSELTLFSMDTFSFDNHRIITVTRDLLLSNMGGVHRFGSLRFSSLNALSIIDTPLDGNEIYGGSYFQVKDANFVGTSIQDINALLLKMQEVENIRFANNDKMLEIAFYQTGKLKSFEASGNQSLLKIIIPNITEIDKLIIGDHDSEEIWGVNFPLTTVEFASLTTVGDMVVVGNRSLNTFSVPALKSVIQVPGAPSRCDFVGNGYADMVFPGLERAACRFWFKDLVADSISMPKLEEIKGTSQLTFEVGGTADDDNLGLKSIELPELVNAENTVFMIGYNSFLTRINLDKQPSVKAINIYNNDSFDQCQAVKIWQDLGERGEKPKENQWNTNCP